MNKSSNTNVTKSAATIRKEEAEKAFLTYSKQVREAANRKYVGISAAAGDHWAVSKFHSGN